MRDSSNAAHVPVTNWAERPMSPSDAQIPLRDLAAEARAGNDAAAATLMAGVHQIALRYARARLGRFSATSDAAADVAQEVCVAVLAALPRYVDRGEAGVFLLRHLVGRNGSAHHAELGVGDLVGGDAVDERLERRTPVDIAG